MSEISNRSDKGKRKIVDLEAEDDEYDEGSQFLPFSKKLDDPEAIKKRKINKERGKEKENSHRTQDPVVVPRTMFEQISDMPPYIEIADALNAFINKLKGVEEIDVFTNRDVFALASDVLPLLVKMCNGLKLAVAPISLIAPPGKCPLVVPHVPDSLIPPGIQMIRNSISEMKETVDKLNANNIKEPKRRFAEPMDQSVKRLLDPYQIIRDPRVAEPVPTQLHPLLAHTKENQAKTIKADGVVFVNNYIRRSPEFKTTLTEFCTHLLQYCTALQKPEIHLAVAAQELFGRKRNPVLVSLYCTFIYASAVKSLYYGSFSKLPSTALPVEESEFDFDFDLMPPPLSLPIPSTSAPTPTPTLKRRAHTISQQLQKKVKAVEEVAPVQINLPFTEDEKENPKYDPKEIERDEEEERHEWWKKIGCYDLYKATLGSGNSLGQCIPTNTIHFLRQGIKKISCVIDFCDKKWKDTVHQFCGMVSRSLIVEGAILPKDLFHDTILRLCFFHLQVMRCYEFMHTKIIKRAISMQGYEHYSEKTPFIELLIKLHPKIELDPKNKRHFMSLASGIVRCPGEGYLEHERTPWHQPDPVKVRDNASVGERQLALKLESTSFSKLITNPELLVEGLPEHERDPRTVLALSCLAYMFLLDYHLTAKTYDEATGKLERYLQNHIGVYPQQIQEKCMGAVIIVGRQFFVYSWDGLIDVKNNPALLISVIMNVLRKASPDYAHQARNLTMELQSMANSLKIFGDKNLEVQFTLSS
jgi:hypothetical protein